MQSSRTKRRDMARSILPSKYRSPGKLIQKAKRANRRDVRAGLRAIRHDPDPLNDDWDERMDFCAYPDAEIHSLVYWRRGGDKIAHFERWAIQTTKDKPIEDRLSYLQSILPDGLIGDHAMSHLRRCSELNPTRPYWRYSYEERERARVARAKRDRYRRRRLAWAITCAMQDGLHKDMNAVLKQGEPDEPDPVLLRHTVAHQFVEDLYVRNRVGGIVHRAALLRLIDFLDAERYVRAEDVLPPAHYAGAIYD